MKTLQESSLIISSNFQKAYGTFLLRPGVIMRMQSFHFCGRESMVRQFLLLLLHSPHRHSGQLWILLTSFPIRITIVVEDINTGEIILPIAIWSHFTIPPSWLLWHHSLNSKILLLHPSHIRLLGMLSPVDILRARMLLVDDHLAALDS